jgi:hypothetical protein
VFNYKKGHSVIKVTDEAAIRECKIPPEPNGETSCGHDVVTLTSMGGVGFMSGGEFRDDCSHRKMRFWIPEVKCPHVRPKA